MRTYCRQQEPDEETKTQKGENDGCPIDQKKLLTHSGVEEER